MNLRAPPLKNHVARNSRAAKLAGKVFSALVRARRTEPSTGGYWRTMQKCPACGNKFIEHQCPSCGGKPVPSARQINKALNKYPLPSLGGLFGVLAAVHFYPPLDRNPVFLIALCVFFSPMVFHIVCAVRKRLPLDVNRLKSAYQYCGAAMVSLALTIAGNGVLDMSPVKLVKTSILRKSVTSGRHSSTHHFFVTSWRPGRSTEDLAVVIPLYVRASIGQSITVEVHSGLFGLPWYGQIVLEK